MVLFDLSFFAQHYLDANFFIMGTNTGTVKFFIEDKGFGFITDDSDKKDYFVHVKGLIDKIAENDKVSYNLVEGRKGMNAVDVKLA